MNTTHATQTADQPAASASVAAVGIGSIDLLGWFEENAAELVAESHAIADTGDFSTTWVVYEHHGYPGGKPKRVPVGYGATPAQAIRDAMLMRDDPAKWTHVAKPEEKCVRCFGIGMIPTGRYKDCVTEDECPACQGRGFCLPNAAVSRADQ